MGHPVCKKEGAITKEAHFQGQECLQVRANKELDNSYCSASDGHDAVLDGDDDDDDVDADAGANEEMIWM